MSNCKRYTEQELEQLLQDCLDFALDVPECGCAHSSVCSSCERYREAQRLAEQLKAACAQHAKKCKMVDNLRRGK